MSSFLVFTLNLETYWTKFEAQEGVSLVQATLDSFAQKWEIKEGILATIYASYVETTYPNCNERKPRVIHSVDFEPLTEFLEVSVE